VVEGARLESVYTVMNRIAGSNPAPSARPAGPLDEKPLAQSLRSPLDPGTEIRRRRLPDVRLARFTFLPFGGEEGPQLPSDLARRFRSVAARPWRGTPPENRQTKAMKRRPWTQPERAFALEAWQAGLHPWSRGRSTEKFSPPGSRIVSQYGRHPAPRHGNGSSIWIVQFRDPYTFSGNPGSELSDRPEIWIARPGAHRIGLIRISSIFEGRFPGPPSPDRSHS
jgi:hypothetical protein